MATVALSNRVFNARPDTMDFRDLPYQPSLVEVAPVLDLDRYRRYGIPVLDQGNEGACTGFGLATVANYLLRRRESDPDVTLVSPRMLYEMAKLYDEWDGEDYEGSSARAAVKGWHKHGVCSSDLWSYEPGKRAGGLNTRRVEEAAKHPLGAYYRVNHRDLVAMHTALAEVGIVYATAVVHDNWASPDTEGVIAPRTDDVETRGGHAFAVVAYDERGFWIQNSWGPGWGMQGFGLIRYEDWLKSATDAWVAQLGVPMTVGRPTESVEDFTEENQPHVYTFAHMRPHVITIGDDGALAKTGTYASDSRGIARLVDTFVAETEPWAQRRVVIYAHGGLVPASQAVRQAARLRTQFMAKEIYPFFLVWNTDWYSTLVNMIDDLFERWSADAPAGGPFDFILDRTDDMLERAARSTLLARAGWSEIKENGIRATGRANGGARTLADALRRVHPSNPFDINLVGHSAGSILLGGLAKYIGVTRSQASPVTGKGLGMDINSVSLWAPAVTMDLFRKTYLPLVRKGKIDQFSVFALRDHFERDDSAGPYRKSILYLVSNALERRARIPLFRPDGEALLGMEKFLESDDQIKELKTNKKIELVLGPTGANTSARSASKATTHVGYSSDTATHLATINRILRSRSKLDLAVPMDALDAHEIAQSISDTGS